MNNKMDDIIDKVADAGEKIQNKMSHDDKPDTDADAPSGAHRGEAAEEHKHGIMDKIADATEKLVEKFDHSDDTAASTNSDGPVTSTPPVEIPGPALGSESTSRHMDPTGKIV